MVLLSLCIGVLNMQWLNKMNDALDYIESNLNENIDFAGIAKIACCSLPRFQNMFLFVTDMTVSEYIRMRRMALAGYELTNSDTKIIDLALKYGYESHAAFTRSFKAFHGISPIESRRFNKFIDYPRISFQINISGGHYTMNENTKMTAYKDILIKVERVNYPETLKIAGVPWQDDFGNIGDYHKNYLSRLPNKYEPYTDAEISFRSGSYGQWIFGGRVTSINNLPDGMIGIDTGYKTFDVLTFRATDLDTLLGDENEAGDAMKTAGDYIKNVWYPAHKNETDSNDGGEKYIMSVDGVEWTCGGIGIYKNTSKENPEMCYFLPLAENREQAKITYWGVLAPNDNPEPADTQTYQDIEAMQIIPEKYETLKFGKYDWRVLDRQDGKIFIISDIVIEYRQYHHSKTKVTWEQCDLRGYLNSQFYDTFSDEEKAQIIKTTLSTNNNPWYKPGQGGNDTEDYVFLLSVEEVVKYFGDSGDLIIRKGWYWGGGEPYNMILKDSRGQMLYDQFNTARIAKNINGKASWWRLRSPGRANIYDAVISPNGIMGITGTPVEDDNGIRPAMWVKT